MGSSRSGMLSGDEGCAGNEGDGGMGVGNDSQLPDGSSELKIGMGAVRLGCMEI